MRVLVVEDEAVLAQQLRSHLSTSGYVVDVASDGAEGQYLACTNDYDLAIVDLG
ncbi:MAG TPA: DNA-binding response regulator, partial [Gammaproteobacteria bacterium]|nr:DNA-binding response regulator [Gammaproteobacteria bacterium]